MLCPTIRQTHKRCEKDVRARYDTIKGSAVNPVLREGNSIAARQSRQELRHGHPHRVNGAGQQNVCRPMRGNDFAANETSTMVTAAQAGDAKIELNGTVLKDGIPLAEGTVCDASFMSASACGILRAEIASMEPGVLFRCT